MTVAWGTYRIAFTGGLVREAAVVCAAASRVPACAAAARENRSDMGSSVTTPRASAAHDKMAQQPLDAGRA